MPGAEEFARCAQGYEALEQTLLGHLPWHPAVYSAGTPACGHAEFLLGGRPMEKSCWSLAPLTQLEGTLTTIPCPV